MQNYVFLIDTNKQSLNPIPPARARNLLSKGKAAVFRLFPFTLILKKAVENRTLKPLTLKLDPGSKFTGIALLDGEEVIWVAELQHRGQQIKSSLASRRALRCGRRSRQTRYRQPRFDNRKRQDGWLPPSLLHRVQTTETWVKRLMRYAPITNIVMELVKFDTQLMRNAEISGVEYQQGELVGYQVREYLLEKFQRQCVYCNIQDVPLQIEHISPKSKGGSNRVSNLTLACEQCNLKKGSQSLEQFLNKDSGRLEQINKQAKAPLKDTTAVNATRWKLHKALNNLLPTTTGSGGQTKYNRTRLGLAKRHWIDAAVVGNVENINFRTQQPLNIKSTGWGSRQMCGTNKFGFPTRHRARKQVYYSFSTGDIIKAIVPSGKKVGNYVGRVLCRATGSFDIATKLGRVAGISYKFCSLVNKKDGYSYAF